MNKAEGMNAKYRASGSGDIVAAARSVVVIGRPALLVRFPFGLIVLPGVVDGLLTGEGDVRLHGFVFIIGSQEILDILIGPVENGDSIMAHLRFLLSFFHLRWLRNFPQASTSAAPRRMPHTLANTIRRK